MADRLTALDLRVESPFDEPALTLTAELAAEVVERYADSGEDSDPSEPVDPNVFLPPGGAFVVARLDGEPVGCGAVRRHGGEHGTGEVKRMYVRPGAPGLGVARLVLAELEAIAADLGYTRLRLETGLRQPEAVRLYETAGWHRIEPYGFYADSPLSVCFGKDLA